jgi:hypothetical protein
MDKISRFVQELKMNSEELNTKKNEHPIATENKRLKSSPMRQKSRLMVGA